MRAVDTWSLLRTFSLLWSVFLAGAALAACGYEDKIEHHDPPVIQVTPSSVTFPALSVGQSVQRAVTVGNEGASALIITGFDVQTPGNVFTVDGLEGLFVPPGEGATFTITYTPDSAAQVTGRVNISSNGGYAVVDLNSQQLSGRIIATPNPLDFGRVEPGTTVLEPVTLQNIGNIDLTVTNVQVLSGSGEFRASTDDLGQFPATLSPGGGENDEVIVNVEFSPTSAGFANATMIVMSDDPNAPEYRVPIQANGAKPCIQVSNEGGYEFGERLVDRTDEGLMTITNCSDPNNGETLVVDSVQFLDTAEYPLNEAFGLDLSGLPLPLELEPGASDDFIVTYTPTAVGTTDRGLLEIISNDDFKSPLEIEVTGIGSDNACPTAVAGCWERGSGAPPTDFVQVEDGAVIDCTAMESSDADGEVAEYRWELLERPVGSTADFDNRTDEEVSFFADLIGTYRVELDVTDNEGARACDPVEVRIDVSPRAELYVELTWTTPDDADETDHVGTDMDLHLLYGEEGCWEDERWDANARNGEPVWFEGASRSNPQIDIDDTDGAGPEVALIPTWDRPGTYAIGAHYFDDREMGSSTAHIRVYVLGELAFEQQKLLEGTGAFWHAVNLELPSEAVSSVDTYHESIAAACE